MSRCITVLGSTGSIGTQTLSVVREHNMKIKALSAYQNVELLEQQVREFRPEYVCIYDESLYSDLKARLADTGVRVLTGMEGLCQVASLRADCVLNALVGMVGIRPTLAAIDAGNDIALANKETLVAAGRHVIERAREKDVRILPVDSEHSAIFQCLLGNDGNRAKKIILTASGGPFFGYTINQLHNVTKADALRHPNWNMGEKITIDSATMMNKGLEIIEAMWLFGVTPQQIEVVVHRQSIVHSAIEYEDGAVIAQLGVPDMRIPIQYALTYYERLSCSGKKLSLTDIGTLTFEKPDEKVFRCLALAKQAAEKLGNACCVLNSANEKAVEMFLKNKIDFVDIPRMVEHAMREVPYIEQPTLEQIFETEQAAHEAVTRRLGY